MKLKLHISPCPNDTFMFDALINGRIETDGLQFEVQYHDIEQLNLRAKMGEADVTKISYAVTDQITGLYAVIDSGSALGRGNGPLLVARKGDTERVAEALKGNAAGVKIAVPGLNTTANLLMERLFPSATEKHELLFSEIAQGVAGGAFDTGVLIHEGRFTYGDNGLGLVYDLGAQWEGRTGRPLPLGAIAVSRSVPPDVAKTFESLLRESIQYAFAHPEASGEYIKSHAQEMDDAVIKSHIELFVNDYSLSLGQDGREAVLLLTGVDCGAFL